MFTPCSAMQCHAATKAARARTHTTWYHGVRILIMPFLRQHHFAQTFSVLTKDTPSNFGLPPGSSTSTCSRAIARAAVHAAAVQRRCRCHFRYKASCAEQHTGNA
eukprot:4172888-Amphidinium_carterae.1